MLPESKIVNGIVYYHAGNKGIPDKYARIIYKMIKPYISDFQDMACVGKGYDLFYEKNRKLFDKIGDEVLFDLCWYYFPTMFRSKGRNLKRIHTEKEWELKKKQFNYSCAYCGISNIKLTKDHMIPVSKGGTDEISNIVPACWPCNYKKRAKPAEMFIITRNQLNMGIQQANFTEPEGEPF